MSGGPLLPSSVYFGGASGKLYPAFYIPATNTNNAGAIEGIGVIASLGSDAAVVLQFNMPESIPSGTAKLRALAWANATSGTAKVTPTDGVSSPGSNIGAAGLNGETPSQISQTWTTADVIVENKLALGSSPTANQILTVLVTFNATGWTLAAISVWAFSIVWE
jgi:hypothetical protein